MGNLISSYFLKRRNRGVLPEDLILAEILPKLPVKSLLRFKCVSKKWFDQITNHSSFKGAQLCNHSDPEIIILAKSSNRKEHEIFLLLKDGKEGDQNPKAAKIEISHLFKKGVRKSDDITILGSSKGLILLSNTFPQPRRNLILWNPVTREFRSLPNPIPLTQGLEFDLSIRPLLDLGFDENDNDHKIVRVLEVSFRNEEGFSPIRSLSFQVFSKRSNFWRKLKPFLGYKLLNMKPGVSLNGTLYFLAQQVSNTWHDRRTCVLSFDFGDEEVHDIVDVPDRFNSFDLATWKEQSLALIALNRDQTAQFCIYDFWVMINDQHVDHHDDHQKGVYYWIKLFKFDTSLFQVWNDCGVWREQFLVVLHRRRGTELRLWDPFGDPKRRRRRGSKIAKVGPNWFFSSAHSFDPSLVSVYSDEYHRKVKEIEGRKT